MSRPGSRRSRRPVAEVVTPLIYFSASRVVLGAPAEIEVMAEHAGQLEDGLMLLDDLDLRWGADGELAAIARLAPGAEMQVSWDTVLLLTVARPPGIEVELVTRRAARVGWSSSRPWTCVAPSPSSSSPASSPTRAARPRPSGSVSSWS